MTTTHETTFCIVFITCPEDDAQALAHTLVEERLAACCNIIPGITSIYRWKGKLEEDKEALLVVKTRYDVFESLEKRVREIHSYEVPEIVQLPITAGSKPYLEWIERAMLKD